MHYIPTQKANPRGSQKEEMLRFGVRAIVRGGRIQMRTIATNDVTPSAVVDIIEPVNGEFVVRNAQNFGDILKGHKRAVVFALPGAFTPICSEKHLPGFIEKAEALRAKGVEDIYCLSVNDFFVMKAWGKATAGLANSGIKLVADGNGDFTRALGMELDLTGGRLGLRCTRFASVVENGVFKSVEVDVKGLEKSSADSILASL
jgi:peroxiredoxin